MSQNQEKAIREKNEHLGIEIKKQEQKLKFFEEANINDTTYKDREQAIRAEMLD